MADGTLSAVAEQSEVASLRRQLEATQKRLDTEIQRCGKAEGALAVTEQRLKDTTTRLEAARKSALAHWDTVLALRAQVADLEDHDERRAKPRLILGGKS